jgi:alkylation response protein AidB-like acyl-CoA dehydrogenase
VDTRDSPEQAELRRSAGRLGRDLGPTNVADLDDATRSKRLAGAVRDAGWLALRDDAGGGEPLASSAETAIVAEALGASVADVAFTGPVLAADLARRAGADATEGAVVAWDAALTGAARVAGDATGAPLYAVDAAGEDIEVAYALVPDGDGHRLGIVRIDAAGAPTGADLTRAVLEIPPGTPVETAPQGRLLMEDDLASWSALGLALTSADLVGVMRGALDLTVEYARERRQFDVPVGSFQAVQHLLADACCLLEGSTSVALHASWAADELAASDALAAGRVAKAYCTRAARTVCETAVQVHGGIGNTWECMVHVFLRRALLSAQWLGDDGEHLRALASERLVPSRLRRAAGYPPPGRSASSAPSAPPYRRPSQETT